MRGHDLIFDVLLGLKDSMNTLKVSLGIKVDYSQVRKIVSYFICFLNCPRRHKKGIYVLLDSMLNVSKRVEDYTSILKPRSKEKAHNHVDDKRVN